MLKRTVLFTAVLFGFFSFSHANVRLPSVFSDHMVLQRDAEVTVWGWADPQENVTLTFNGQTLSTKTDANGKWRVQLAPMPARAEPGVMSIRGENEISIKDVLVGEVWVCSGQSNMEWTLNRTTGKDEAAADNPLIRHFKVPHVTAVTPKDDVNASWVVATKESTMGFTAVGYHFALNLVKELNVPVGLLNNSWGGSRIEPFVSLEGMKAQKTGLSAEAEAQVENLEKLVALAAQADAEYVASVKRWIAGAELALASGDPLPKLPGHPLKQPSAQSLAMKYNGMVHPLIPYTIRGALWYQGESNMGNDDYTAKMEALIRDWRTRWGQGDFPFYYVQLAPFRRYSGEQLGRFWEQQENVLGLVKNTGMAVITDISTLTNIHPPNKTDVGYRLAQLALHHDYGRDALEYSGPVFSDMAVEGDKAVLSFTHADGLSVKGDGPLKWFEVAGADKQFHPAAATIVNGKVELSSDKVPQPVAVRMGWQKDAEPALCNSAGLVASPFRTDDW